MVLDEVQERGETQARAARELMAELSRCSQEKECWPRSNVTHKKRNAPVPQQALRPGRDRRFGSSQWARLPQGQFVTRQRGRGASGQSGCSGCRLKSEHSQYRFCCTSSLVYRRLSSSCFQTPLGNRQCTLYAYPPYNAYGH